MKQHVVAQSSDGRYIVRLNLAEVWKGHIEDTKLETGFEANPDGLQRHAHFEVFITDDGERVVVFEPAIDERLSANLLVFNRDLRLLKGFTLNDLLTKNDQGAVTHSISQCQFTDFDNAKGRRYGLEDDGKTFAIHLRSRRTALISLAEPKIILTPDVIPEVFEFEEGPPPGKTDYERFQGKWMITDGRSGTIMLPSNYFTDDPQYYLFVRNRVLTPGRRFDKFTYLMPAIHTPLMQEAAAGGSQIQFTPTLAFAPITTPSRMQMVTTVAK
jgi:hypothetical protein